MLHRIYGARLQPRRKNRPALYRPQRAEFPRNAALWDLRVSVPVGEVHGFFAGLFEHNPLAN
jgi:hypothetical protein